MRTRLTRDFYIPAGATKVQDRQSDAVAYLFTNSRGKPAACVFYGKQSKPVAQYWFRTEAERERSVTRYFEGRRAHEKRIADARKEQSEYQHDYHVGDILNTCWGYDQTNREFFQVVEVRGKWLILREIMQARRDTGWEQGECVPQSDAFKGEPIRRLATKYGVTIDNVRTAHKWNTSTVAGVPVGPALHWTSYA